MQTVDDAALWESWLAHTWLPATTAADEAGLFRALAGTPMSSGELAQRLNLNKRVVGALLPLLASLGHLVCQAGRYHTTESTHQYLTRGAEGYWGTLLSFHRVAEGFFRTLKASMVTLDLEADSQSSKGSRWVSDAWANGELTPSQAAILAEFMHGHSLFAATQLATDASFQHVRRLADVGGGSGCYSIALAARYDAMHCTVIDLPAMCACASQYISRAGLQNRIDTMPLNLLAAPFPRGYDVHLMSNVLHDWDDGTCRMLLEKSFAALRPGTSIKIHEVLLNEDGNGSRLAASFSLLLAATTRGRQFTGHAIQSLLREAGFTAVSSRRTSPLYSLITAHRPNSGHD